MPEITTLTFGPMDFIGFARRFRRDPVRAFNALPGYDPHNPADMVIFDLGMSRLVFPNEATLAKRILDNAPATKLPMIGRFLLPLEGATLSLRGEDWNARRKQLAPAFLERNIKANLPTLHELAAHYANKIAQSDAADILPLISEYQVCAAIQTFLHERISPELAHTLSEAFLHISHSAYSNLTSLSSLALGAERKHSLSFDPTTRAHSQKFIGSPKNCA